MKRIISMGESIVDMTPQKKNKALSDVSTFTRHAGGAPYNVACALSKLGAESMLISAVGEDGFGEYLINKAHSLGVDVSHIKKVVGRNTPLSFVAITADGDRDFVFFRNGSADTEIYKNDIPRSLFKGSYAFHFGSVSLVESPTRYSHLWAIESARKYNLVITFDVNMRLSLFPSGDFYKRAVMHFASYCDVVKMNMEEAEYLSGGNNYRLCIDKFLSIGVKLVVVTKGKQGAEMYSASHAAEYRVMNSLAVAVDTTGAGDAFMAALLYKLDEANVKSNKIGLLSERSMYYMLEFACRYATESTKKYGAVDSYLTLAEFNKKIAKLTINAVKKRKA